MSKKELPPVTRRNTLLRYSFYGGMAWAMHIGLYSGTFDESPLVVPYFYGALSLVVIALLIWGLRLGVFTPVYFIRELVIFGSLMGLGSLEGNLPIWLICGVTAIAIISEYRLTRDL